MPEYLAPGVYIEETSFRPKTIEGVSTSTAGFVGPTRYGPIAGEPVLVTSFGEFERIYGGLDPFTFIDSSGSTAPMRNFMAHAVRAFFEEGGRRLYVSRAYRGPVGQDGSSDLMAGYAGHTIDASPADESIALTARYPGAAGNMTVTFTARVSQNGLIRLPDANTPGSFVPALRGIKEHDLVLVSQTTGSPPTEFLAVAQRASGAWRFTDSGGSATNLSSMTPPDPLASPPERGDAVRVVTIDVTIDQPGQFARPATYEGLSMHPRHLNAMRKTFAMEPSSRQLALTVPLVVTLPTSISEAAATQLAVAAAELLLPNLNDQGSTSEFILTNGSDGQRPGSTEYVGVEELSLDIDSSPPAEVLGATGLIAFENIPDISIIAAPGSTFDYNNEEYRLEADQIVRSVISHCERMRYRIAVLDAPDKQAISEIRAFRGQIDSTHAALYYPWVNVLDPLTREETTLPPSGFISGIYARNDTNRGVHKAPANEVVRSALNFERAINKAQQDVLNPEGINCLRWFQGRGYRVWGARTISSDPEWKYVNLRRYFAYLERSIDVGTQWVVFEPNGPALWANVRRTIEDFLFNEFKSGRLLGTTPETSYFVRCDRSTMTQNDIDNGRLICLIGVAPLRPAEFVIFRIGQWTAESQ